jgi:hypothetical protein
MAQPLKNVSDDNQRAPVAAPEGNIVQRVNAVMREVRGVEKASTNQHGNYKYAGHQAVNDAIRDSFARHGIVQIVSVLDNHVDGGTVTVKVRVSWISTDSAGSRIDMDGVGIQPSQTTKGGVTAQQVGQAISYAVKCVQFKGLMLRGDNEEDADEGDPNGPRDDGGRGAAYDDQDHGYSHANGNDGNGPPDAKSLAVDYLARFTECKNSLEVKALSDEIKANWAALRGVRDFADHLVKARQKALGRFKPGVAKTGVRQPGED